MKKLFILFFALVATTALWAEDFAAGDIYLYFNIIGEKAVEVTFRGEKYYSYGDEYFGNLVIPDSVIHNGKTYHVISIGGNAFCGCKALSTVVIPNSVVSISRGAFSYSSIDSIVIGKGVRSIGTEAFYNCRSLTSITIPDNVKSIEGSAFNGCSGLTSIIVEGGNTKFDSRDNCNAIIETATNTLIAGGLNTIIPNSVTSIGSYAFKDCESLTSITIPNSVTSIRRYAFEDCTSLTSVTIPNSVTSIGFWAFKGCESLTSVTIPNSATNIDNYAFPSHTNIIRQ